MERGSVSLYSDVHTLIWHIAYCPSVRGSGLILNIIINMFLLPAPEDFVEDITGGAGNVLGEIMGVRTSKIGQLEVR